MSKEKLSYIDYFRAIAIIFIVLGHTMIWGKSGGIIKITNDFFLKGGTFAFVFIAGFLFQYLSYKFNYWEYLKKKFNNVFMPYIITLTPAAFILAFTLNFSKHEFYQFSIPTRLISCYLGSFVLEVPLWFMGMIFIYFLFAPVLLYLKNKKIIWYTILIISFIVTVFMKRPAHFMITTEGPFIMWASFLYSYFLRFIYFSFAYLFGMEMSTILENHYENIKKYSLRFLSILIPLYLVMYLVFLNNYKILKGFQTLPKMISVLIILLFLVKIEYIIKNNAFLDKALKFVANYSFGIFFIHYYLFNLLMRHCIYKIPIKSYLDISHNSLYSFLNSLTLFLIVFFGSILILYILKKLLTKLGVENTRRFIGV